MRIAIVGPAKTGNVWLKCLLAEAYGLTPLGPRLSPDRPTEAAFRAWVAAGGFRDDAVYHQHYDFSPSLADAIDAVPAHAVTIIRDPYDAFVSMFYAVQQADTPEKREKRVDSAVLVGKPIDHPDVVSWLRGDGFRGHLEKAVAWVEGGRSRVVRYEDLLADTVGELARLTAAVAPTTPERIDRAVSACSAEAMRRDPRRAPHVRVAVAGDAHAKLGPGHLGAFRDRHADLITRLGYPVRDPGCG